MNRLFIYQDNHEEVKATYTDDKLQHSFNLENERLSIYVSSGQDGVSFEITKTDLQEGIIGSYALKSLPNPDAGKAKTTYSYSSQEGSGSIYFSQANFIEGSVIVTDYNVKHSLISGKFEVKLKDVADPALTSPTPTPRRCDVIVTGEFKNARLTSNP